MSHDPTDFSKRWTDHLRKNARDRQVFPCPKCNERPFKNDDDRWRHILGSHGDLIPADEEGQRRFREGLGSEWAQKKPGRHDVNPTSRPGSAANNPSKPHSKRPLTASSPQPASDVSDIQALSLKTAEGQSGTRTSSSQGLDKTGTDQPRKRAALDDGGSPSSSLRAQDSVSSPPNNKGRPASAQSQDASQLERMAKHKDPFENPARPPIKGNKRLFDPGGDTTVSQEVASNRRGQVKHERRSQPKTLPPAASKATSSHAPGVFPASVLQSSNEMFLQPETRPISQDQLLAEVKGIYAGLVMVEAKCIEVDDKQAARTSESGSPPSLNNDQWQALIALHRTLLHEHHDFFLASQHPSASPVLRRMASKYSMPARMWRHGIHSFLELLRRRLPASQDHMLAFIYLAYSMMALLYETVPAFKETWLECLGDLCRFRMLIPDQEAGTQGRHQGIHLSESQNEDQSGGEGVWVGVARQWFSKASDISPTTGRLYHQIALLATPNQLEQLFFYSKSLAVDQPCLLAREAITTFFDQTLGTPLPAPSPPQPRDPSKQQPEPVAEMFVRLHAILYTRQKMETFQQTRERFLKTLNKRIARYERHFLEVGYRMAVANNVALLGFASRDNPLMKALTSPQHNDTEMTGVGDGVADKYFIAARQLSIDTMLGILERAKDPYVLSFIHVTLVFLDYLSFSPKAFKLVEPTFPWQPLAEFLNTLPVKSLSNTFPQIENIEKVEQGKEPVRPFPEDFAIRGFLWTIHYFPEPWFQKHKVDDEERYMEVASMSLGRQERIVWLARRLAKACTILRFDEAQKKFIVTGTEISDRCSSVESSSTIGRGTEDEISIQPPRSCASETSLSQDSTQHITTYKPEPS